MTAPIYVSYRLFGPNIDGDLTASFIRCNPVSAMRRSVGLSPDQIQLEVKTSEWVGSGFRIDRPFAIEFGDFAAGETVRLGGWMLSRTDPLKPGYDPTDVSGTLTAQTLRLSFVSLPAWLGDARGGLIGAGTKNPLGPTGLVDTESEDYLTPQAAANLLLDAAGLGGTCPAGINVGPDGVTPAVSPGPLDWGNARALPELADFLRWFGWAATLALDGSELVVHRLARAGETVTLPGTWEIDLDRRASQPTSRAMRIVVTSGRTRKTRITRRTLGGDLALEWVGYDDRTGRWLNGTEWAGLYGASDNPADLINPGDIEAFRAGPIEPAADGGSSAEIAAAFGRIFSALRLHPDELVERSGFVAPGRLADRGDGEPFAASACYLDAVAAVAVQGSHFTDEPKTPTDGSGAATPVRIEGASAIAGDGVFRLPSTYVYARFGGTGSYEDAQALTGDQLQVTFAHESRVGFLRDDYFVAVFDLSYVAGVLTATEVTADAAINAALADPFTPKVSADFLREVVLEMPGVDEVLVNRDELVEQAKELALRRGGETLVLSGTIELRGIPRITPGDANGAVTAVTWQPEQWRTLVEINGHETPLSEFAGFEAAAGRSLVAGLRRAALPASSAAVRETRAGGAPLTGGGSGTAAEPERQAAVRGREVADVALPRRNGPGLVEAVPPLAPGIRSFFARILGGAGESSVPNRFEYPWEMVKYTGEGGFVAAGPTHAIMGPAFNMHEADGLASLQTPGGISVVNFPPNWSLQPIGPGTVVLMYGPFRNQDLERDEWLFAATNDIDGVCPEVPA